MGYRNEVLDAYRFIDLSPDLFGYDGHAESLAGGVDRGRSSCRAASGYQQVVFADDGSGGGLRCAEALLQFVQQFGQGAAPDVYDLVAAEYCRYGL